MEIIQSGQTLLNAARHAVEDRKAVVALVLIPHHETAEKTAWK